MDPLSDLIASLKPTAQLSAGLRAGGAWSLAFEAPPGVKFNTVIEGHALLRVEGQSLWTPLHPGDAFLLPLGLPFVLASAPDLEPVDSQPLYAAAGGRLVYQGGESFFLLGGRFTFEGRQARTLFQSLPPSVVVPTRDNGSSALRWTLEHFAEESERPSLGSRLMSEHLFHLMLVEVLRYVLAGASPKRGLFAALADPQLVKVIAAVHSAPGRPWSLAALADEAAMSRSAFAERFRATLGQAPMAYVQQVRMEAAAHQLENPQVRVSEAAEAAGYESETAFRKAFRRVHGASPRAFRSR